MAGDDLLARAGGLDVRLARTAEEIAAAQALRYRVFFEEGGAVPTAPSRVARLDLCRFDDACDHIVAFDARGEAVAAYRLLRDEVARSRFGFYSAGEFDVAALVARHAGVKFMELGRSCVAAGYRHRRAIEVLWRGVWAFALRHGVDVMFGCASLPAADPAKLAPALAWLTTTHAADPEWRVAPAKGAKLVAIDSGAAQRCGPRDLPPLIKGYLRLGARFSAEAVIDESFGAADVLVVLRVADIEARYLQHFAPEPIAA